MARDTAGWSGPVAGLGGLLALGGAVLLGLGVLGVSSTATPNMHGFHPGQTVTVGGAGMSVWARTGDVREEAVCVATGQGGDTVLERPVTDFTVAVSGSDFHEVARTPAAMPAGSYSVTCHDTTERLYAGPRATEVVAPGVVGELGLVLGALLLLAALVMGLLWLANRGGQRDRSDAQRLAPGYQAPGQVQPHGAQTYSSYGGDSQAGGASPYGDARHPYGAPTEAISYGEPGPGPPPQPPTAPPAAAAEPDDGQDRPGEDRGERDWWRPNRSGGG